MVFPSRFVGVAVFVLAAGHVAAQQPTFRAGVNYVRVDVVVTDKSDQPITDLTKDDFSIVDQGRPQTIDSFQFMSVPVDHRAVDASAVSMPPPDVATNVPPSSNSRLFAIVVDDLHLIESDTVRIKRVLSDLIDSVSSDDEVALVFVGHSNLSVNFTRDTARLRSAIDHVRDAMGFGLDALASEPDGRGTALSASGTILTRPAGNRVNYARSAAFTLRNTASALAGSGHARRAIVYVSGGTTLKPYVCAGVDPSCSPAFADEMMDVYEAARRADVPIYTIDPRGAVTPEEAVRGGISVINNERIRKQIVDNIKVQQDYLSEVATNTGGRAFTNMSDLARAVREIVGENGSYYLLGYYPNPSVTDGKFHELKVYVNRPGVRVRARQGYIAPMAGKAAVTASSALDTAMTSGVNVAGLPIRVFAAPLATGPKGVATAVSVEVAYPPPADGSRAIDDTIDLGVIAVDPDGKIKAQSKREMKFTATLAAPASGPLTFLVHDVIDLPSQLLTLRVGVASRALGTAGTSQMPIDVPKLSSSHLQLTGIVIGLDGAQHEPSLNAAVIGPLLPFQPTAARTFVPSDTMRVYMRAFWGGKESAADVRLTVSGPVTLPSKTITLTGSRTNGHAEGTLDTTMPLTALSAGRYVLTIEAHLANGESARRALAFEVAPPR